MKRTQDQNSKLHALLTQTGLTEQKYTLALSFSDGRTEKTSDLTVLECRQLIEYLEEQLRAKRGFVPSEGGDHRGADTRDPADKMRKKILSICHQLGWYRRREDGTLITSQRTGRPMLDMHRINKFCRERGKFKKELNDHSVKELQVLIAQFNALLSNTVKKNVEI